MTATKFLIPFVLVSLAGHILVLALTTRIVMTGSRESEKVMKVELKAETEIETPPPSARNEPAEEAARAVTIPDGYREDTVSMQNPDSRYESYLLPISRKIERLWTYPAQAIAEKQEGTAVIRFTIDAGGALKGNRITSSSGNPILDEGALAVIRAASPFAPLPAAFHLSRLHVTAEFRYRLGN
jgi:periplasmic protein TonB